MQQEHVVVHSMTSMSLSSHTQTKALVAGFCEGLNTAFCKDVAAWMFVR